MISAFSSLMRPSLRLNNLFPHSIAAFSKAPVRLQHTLHGFPSSVLQSTRQNVNSGSKRVSYLLTGASIAGVGLGLASLQRPIYCDAPTSPPPQSMPTTPRVDDDPSSLPPKSSVSAYELGFGTVAGICAGVFVKKGAKAVAWFLGGIFVLLQYMGSASLVRVDWKNMSTKFENAFHKKDVSGQSKPPTVISLWNWTIDFLTADFQPRASFVAGFILGLRIG